ncbi:hypothetical protein [Roseivivax sediminis]|uniref:Uncharacterized protein n=1 Tax=Roseivivax sediminis TaxID=936889 RepID=A0A1I1WE83_9RHOB|nr:hypothetical protein [Roseivivax sediminis]SFD93464.1 hypothetical protein SAMN04515678_104275 [Roseivivax sediminis]
MAKTMWPGPGAWAVAMLLGAAAWAQDASDVPAELPPESYEGRQYVDSRGCAFIRAGIDGTTSWVPRVTRSREHICGQTPSLSGAPEPQADPQPERIARAETIAPPEPRTEVAAATPPARERRARPAPEIVRPVPEPARYTPRPAPPPRPMVLPAEASACAGGPAGGYEVRCGAASAPATTVVVQGRSDPVRGEAVRDLPGGTRILPLHVYHKRDDQVVRIPEGHRRAWDDDRLNRNRANQSLDGFYATQQIWTNTVPRRALGGRPPQVKDPVVYYR